MPKEIICGVTSSVKYELLLVFCFVVVVLFRSPFVSVLDRCARHHITLSELLKVCQKLQYRGKSSSKQIRNKHSALSLYPSDTWLEKLQSHQCQCRPQISWYVKLDWNQRKMQKENIFQTVCHLNTKNVDCVRTIVDVVWPWSRVEPQKVREKWSLAYV